MTPKTQFAPHGSWKSPITSDLIVSESVGLNQPAIDGDHVYWIEMRPSEGGRNVIVRRDPSGTVTDVNPAPFNARTRVHEYGGGDYLARNGVVYFANFADQRLYQKRPGGEPRAITPEVKMRYADAIMDNKRQSLICVREDHSLEGREALNSLVGLALDGSDNGGKILASGNDFYSSPRLSPDGSRLAWLTWNHPNMPWDGTELWVGEFEPNGTLGKTQRVAGGVSESIFQPEWSPAGVLYFVSDRNGWWNLYRLGSDGAVEILCEKEAEFGMPQWGFGMSTYAFESAKRIICAYGQRGMSKLATIDTTTLKLEEIDTGYTDITYVRAANGRAVFRAGSPLEPPSIVRLDLADSSFEVLRRSNNLRIDAGYISTAQAIEFPTEDGLTAHGFFYAPQNRDYQSSDGELPPLLVKSHGGPTAAAVTAQSLIIQYWTSRGIAVLDVNYGGSSGYGRAYRQRLKDKWGVVDVDDCVNGARYLVKQRIVDGDRLMITGGSAGGYTTLCALTFRNSFRAGGSHYGVSDAEALAKETHKFESRYLDGLFGPYPEQKEVYFQRSPLNFV
ncbi:MAG: prolyl oligopeptidase family serine peptidase, partial [Pyrinomonadaceae bacterium]